MKKARFVFSVETLRNGQDFYRKITVLAVGLWKQPIVIAIACGLIAVLPYIFGSSHRASSTQPPTSGPGMLPVLDSPYVDSAEKPPSNVHGGAAIVSSHFRYTISPRAVGERLVPTSGTFVEAPSASAPITVEVTPSLSEGLALFGLLKLESGYIPLGPATLLGPVSTLYAFEPTPLRVAGVSIATSVLVHVFVASRRLKIIDEETLGLSSVFGRSEFRIHVPAPTLKLREICGDTANFSNTPNCEPLTLAGSGAHLLNDGTETICIEAWSISAPSRPPIVLHGNADGDQWNAIADVTEPAPNGKYIFRFGLLRTDANDQACGSSPRPLPLAAPEIHPQR